MHVRFEPTRLSGERLHRAYELVVPVVTRVRLHEDDEVDTEADNQRQDADEG